MSVSKTIHPVPLAISYLSASITRDAVVGIVPQALVGPCNWLLIVINVGQHDGRKA